jgi:ribonucleoside-diphosphate reductase alpha chain
MFVDYRFSLREKFKNELRSKLVNRQPFQSFIFYRTYSRKKADGSQESWADCVIRVIEGVMSIRLDWLVKNKLPYNLYNYQNFAEKMALSLFEMKWLPPGRGLWAMGTDYVYER